MAHRKHDWDACGDEVVELYRSGLSVREIIPILQERHGVAIPSGTLTNFLGRRGVLRSKAEARKLAISKARRVCEMCGAVHAPKNWNQRWCDVCTGKHRYKKRVTNHGMPAVVIETMFIKQGKRCAICGREFDDLNNTQRKKKLFIDHDHKTLQFRGLLCVRCNTGLSFIDDMSWHKAALEYLDLTKRARDPVFTNPPRMRRYVRNVPVLIDELNDQRPPT